MQLRPGISVAGCALVHEHERILLAHRVHIMHLAKEFCCIVELRLKLLAHLSTHGVATHVYARADRGNQFRCVAPKLAPHCAYTFFRDARQRAAPSGMRSEEHTSELQSHSFISYAV